MVWLQRSQMFIAPPTGYSFGLQRSAMYCLDECIETYISLRWSEEPYSRRGVIDIWYP